VPRNERRIALPRLLAAVTHRLEVLKVGCDVADRTRGVNRRREPQAPAARADAHHPEGAGRGDGEAAEAAELDAAIVAAGMPNEVEKVARKELKRLQRMPEAAAERAMVRTCLDGLIELPCKGESTRRPSVGHCRTIAARIEPPAIPGRPRGHISTSVHRASPHPIAIAARR
jgi:ATP-dependent Lon protease